MVMHCISLYVDVLGLSLAIHLSLNLESVRSFLDQFLKLDVILPLLLLPNRLQLLSLLQDLVCTEHKLRLVYLSFSRRTFRLLSWQRKASFFGRVFIFGGG